MRLALRFNGPAVARPILATRQIFSAGPCQSEVSRDASRAMGLALVIAEPLPSPC
jgi:hypothetical protein